MSIWFFDSKLNHFLFFRYEQCKLISSHQDGHVIIDGFRGKDDEGFFGIYDGHGGRTAVDHVQKTLHKNFEEALKESTSVKEAFVKAYKKTDKELKDLEILYNGTTAVTW